MHAIPAIPLADVNLIAAYSIFITSYFVFVLGKFPGLKIDRLGALIIAAAAMLAFLMVPPREALHFINFSTLVLLLSVMLLVGNLTHRGHNHTPRNSVRAERRPPGNYFTDFCIPRRPWRSLRRKVDNLRSETNYLFAIRRATASVRPKHSL